MRTVWFNADVSLWFIGIGNDSLFGVCGYSDYSFWVLKSVDDINIFKSWKNENENFIFAYYKKSYYISLKYYLSLLSFTVFTFVVKRSSLMTLPWRSSHIITLLRENFGSFPPPTNAKMFVRWSISTFPIPPSRSM